MNSSLVSKYNIPGPRYTSYPTVPFWDAETFLTPMWKDSLLKAYRKSEEVSLYIHLPFCESLCTFCGCNKRITKNHEVELPYIETLLKEWRMYLEVLGHKPVLRELHLGGGTPTFFSSENLEFLLTEIFKDCREVASADLSIEGHPNSTTKKQLEVLAALGFSRISYGVQDYNKTVQIAIHRIQPFEKVKTATEEARIAGFTSVGHDIIFGLPFQTEEHVKTTIENTKLLMPDRIAFYSYAHVPWIKGNGQRGFKDSDLPSPENKRKMYETGKKLLEETGYVEIGMDHFALKTDSLYKAVKNQNLHRNFMGYTTATSETMIGLGVSAISDSWYGFAQNEKRVEDYKKRVWEGELAVFKGHILSEEDLVIRRHILNLMCKLRTNWKSADLYFKELPEVLKNLRELESDGLVKIYADGLEIPENGRAFVRNVCMAFDLRLQQRKPETQLFSMTV